MDPLQISSTTTGDLRETWNDIAYHWGDWGPPLRPCEQDLRITEHALAVWHKKNPVPKARVFLCGVTPEITTMHWPFPIELTGMDQADSMVRVVWPGDIPGVRRGVVGEWRNSGLPPSSQDVVIGDGGFGFFDYPTGQRALMTAMRQLLKPDGLFLYRHFAQIAPREPLQNVLEALRAGRIGNAHVFKWRLAMALQSDSTHGVRQHDIWQAWVDADVESARPVQPGWSAGALRTIEFYRGKQARLHFPTLDEFRSLLEETMKDIEVYFADYELGERCPILTARPRD